VQKRKLQLLFVSYKTPRDHVVALSENLSNITNDIGYSVYVNSYEDGLPVESLFHRADDVIVSKSNIGYGRAINRLNRRLSQDTKYIAALNTDICWTDGFFEEFIRYLDANHNVGLASPRLLDVHGNVVYINKRDPSFLAMFSRRFIPDRLKPRSLLRYDRHYEMMDHDYSKPFESSYLSGSVMVMRKSVFDEQGGFDPMFFLYLEDADLTRRIAQVSKTMYLPNVSVTHYWGRGSHKTLFLTLVNVWSFVLYSLKWGFKLL